MSARSGCAEAVGLSTSAMPICGCHAQLKRTLFYVCGLYIKGLLAVSRLPRVRRACAPPFFLFFLHLTLPSSSSALTCRFSTSLANAAAVVKHWSAGQMFPKYSTAEVLNTQCCSITDTNMKFLERVKGSRKWVIFKLPALFVYGSNLITFYRRILRLQAVFNIKPNLRPITKHN